MKNMFNFGGLIDAFDLLPGDAKDYPGMDTLEREVNEMRKWVEDYFDPDAAEPQLYVISVTGDGGRTSIVEESQLKQSLHEAYCSCGKQWDKCADEVITNKIATLDDAEEWTQNYPTYERHIWLDHGEDYTVQVMRVTPTEIKA